MRSELIQDEVKQWALSAANHLDQEARPRPGLCCAMVVVVVRRTRGDRRCRKRESSQPGKPRS